MTVFVCLFDLMKEWSVSIDIMFKEKIQWLHNLPKGNDFTYRKVASTNASRFVTRLVYMHTQNDNFLIRSLS